MLGVGGNRTSCFKKDGEINSTKTIKKKGNEKF